jgi:hypothetical protein
MVLLGLEQLLPAGVDAVGRAASGWGQQQARRRQHSNTHSSSSVPYQYGADA